MIKALVRRALETLVLQPNHYRLISEDLIDWPARDERFVDIFTKQSGFGNPDIRSPKAQRLYMIYNLAARGAEGDWAECGVYQGSSALVLAECSELYGPSKRHIHIFDSFEGLSPPGEMDGGTTFRRGDFSAPEQIVRSNLSAYDCFDFYRGWIPSRFAEVEAQRFALVHIDVDFYQPTRDALAFFLPRMSSGGVVILDDYGTTITAGARHASDEIAAEFDLPVIKLPFGQACILV